MSTIWESPSYSFSSQCTMVLTHGLTLNEWLFTSLLISCTICLGNEKKLKKIKRKLSSSYLNLSRSRLKA